MLTVGTKLMRTGWSHSFRAAGRCLTTFAV
jgi:hypothetical protein